MIYESESSLPDQNKLSTPSNGVIKTHEQNFSVVDASEKQRRSKLIIGERDSFINEESKEQKSIINKRRSFAKVGGGFISKFILNLPLTVLSKNTWYSELIFKALLNRKRTRSLLGNDVEKQTDAALEYGTIWYIIRKANQKQLEKLLNKDPDKVNERGLLGECPLHMLFLYGMPKHLQLAKYIINKFPDTITATYNKPEYHGENVLHIAIIKQNAEMVEWLLGDPNNRAYNDKLLNTPADGDFFDKDRLCYYGEYPLAFACCTNQWNLAKILIKYGANLDKTDSYGNTILHLLVIHNLPNLYVKFKDCWIKQFNRNKPEMPATLRKNSSAHSDSNTSDEEDNGEQNEVDPYDTEDNPPLWRRLNKENLTPLTLAAKLGQEAMFSFLIEERRIIQWTFGPVRCVLYPLDQLDMELEVK
ncbi:unnamed protein product, partial [Didymodactylos carnosus]